MANGAWNKAAEDARMEEAAELLAQRGPEREYIFTPRDTKGRALMAPIVLKYRSDKQLKALLEAETARVKYLLNRGNLIVADSGAKPEEDFASS